MELLKLLSTNEIVAQLISFLVLLFLLRKFAWKKILGMLDQRRDKIVSEFKRIEDARFEVTKLRGDYEAKIESIEKLAREKIQEAIDEGKKITEQSRKQAHEEAQDIIENTRASVRYELNKAKEELKDKIIELTMKATENVITEKFTEDNDKELVKDFLTKLDKAE